MERSIAERTIRILLVEDHQIVREGLRRMLELEPDMKVVAEAAGGHEALALMQHHTPDIVLMDIKMPGIDGIQLTREMKRLWPDVRILILTMYSDYVKEAIQAGAAGYMSKDLRREELMQAIRAVREGQAPLRLTLEQEQLKGMAQRPPEQLTLSERERQVLTLVAQGAGDKEIVQKLSMSETTVKRTLRHACEKLGAKNRSEAVADAIRRQLI